jgi:hypothetical protein
MSRSLAVDERFLYERYVRALVVDEERIKAALQRGADRWWFRERVPAMQVQQNEAADDMIRGRRSSFSQWPQL